MYNVSFFMKGKKANRCGMRRMKHFSTCFYWKNTQTQGGNSNDASSHHCITD